MHTSFRWNALCEVRYAPPWRSRACARACVLTGLEHAACCRYSVMYVSRDITENLQPSNFRVADARGNGLSLSLVSIATRQIRSCPDLHHDEFFREPGRKPQIFDLRRGESERLWNLLSSFPSSSSSSSHHANNAPCYSKNSTKPRKIAFERSIDMETSIRFFEYRVGPETGITRAFRI